MTDNVSRRGFLRRCLGAAVAAPVLPAIAEAAALPAIAGTTIGMSPWVIVPHLPSDELVDWMACEAIRNFCGPPP